MPVLFSIDLEPPEADLRIDGELDLAAQDRLRSHLRHLRDGTAGEIRIDLANVAFIDCTCLRVLEELRLDLVAAGRSLQLTSAQPSFRLISALAGYDELSRMTNPRLVLIHPRRRVARQPCGNEPAPGSRPR